MREGLTPTPASLLITATLEPTLTPRPSETPLPPPPQPTIAPVEGKTSTQVNVRLEPSTASDVLGTIPANTKVEIIGKDPGENWWQINFPQDAGGKGWVTAQYVTTAAKPEVPIIGGAEAGPNTGNVAVIKQQLNVRSGPGTGFNSVGTLNPNDVVALTGKDPNGAWLQIDYPQGAGPEGKGWINAAFVQANGAENLPIITEAGLIVGTGTPTGIPATPTATLLPAMDDGDSVQSPSVNVTFSASGTHDLQYSSDVSSPGGDAEDWLQFVPYSGSILLEVSCKGNHLQIELIQNGEVIPLMENQACANRQVVPVQSGEPVQVHVSVIANETLTYSSYTLNIRTLP